MLEPVTTTARTKSSSNRSFGFVFAGFFTLLALVRLVEGQHLAWLWLIPGFGFGFVAAVWPSLLAPLNRLWTLFGLLLGRVMQPVVLGLLFFVIVTPVGLLMRAAGKDPLRLKWGPNEASYWLQRDPPGPTPESMQRQF